MGVQELFFHGGNHALKVKWKTNSLIQVLMWAVPVRCTTGEGKASRVMQWERRSMENLQRLCKMSCPSSLDAASGKEEGKGEREVGRIWRLESCGWGRNPTTTMDETKGKARSKTQAEKWAVMERSGVRGALKRSLAPVSRVTLTICLTAIGHVLSLPPPQQQLQADRQWG